LDCYLGVDIGSVSSNFVLLDEKNNLIKKIYLRTQGNPVKAIKNGFAALKSDMDEDKAIKGVGTTGSGRHLASVLLGADVVKNEITAHSVAASFLYPHVKTIIEIGGQDSKIICIKNGIVNDFAMNTVCAAGTGSFLDQQASRLNIAIEEFGGHAVSSRQSVRIAGRCGVFAESDMIHKQQMGYPVVRNYLSNVAKGKKIEEPVVFQGGVAANIGLKKAFEKVLGVAVNIPSHFEVMGAIGSAMLAREYIEHNHRATVYRGDDYVLEGEFTTKSKECKVVPICVKSCVSNGMPKL
jgi:predicted CoA-substrate-specific enzyme activase